MIQADAQSRLYCVHYVPSNIDCPECHSIETDYINRPLYAPLYVPLTNLPTVLDNSQLKLPNSFYVPFNQKSNSASGRQNVSNSLSSDDCVEIKTKEGIVRMPRSTLIHRSRVDGSTSHNNHFSPGSPACNPQQTFPGDFQKHAHRFTRSFSWKTKPEEPPFTQMQPLPKLVKRPDYVEICCKNVCWPTHQLCLCCGRNTAESCRKWSKSTGEYDYIDACWSSCALCSDDAYKILNTPVVYNEKIIDPELLLPLDAELLYYSIQSAKRQQEREQKPSSLSMLARQPLQTKKESAKENIVPFADNMKDIKESPVSLQNLQSDIITTAFQEQQPITTVKDALAKSKQPQKVKSSSSVKAKKSAQSPQKKTEKKKKNNRKKPTKKSSRSKKKSSGSQNRSKPRKKSRSRSRSKPRKKSRSRSRSKPRKKSRSRSRSKKKSSGSQSRSKSKKSRLRSRSKKNSRSKKV